jgi:multidrug efflux pump subunit AcrA (membrane-fusion protein)
MKKLLSVVILTLAMNFLAVAGGVGWLYQSGRLDREKAFAIRDILFPKPVEEKPATQPSEEPTTQPTVRLEDLLAKAAGRSASDQVDFIKTAFYSQMALLDRRQRELTDLQRQVELSKQQATKDHAQLESQQKTLDSREQEAARLASDKGFQDSLALYNKMQPKQVKTVFMGMTDPMILSYLQAMQTPTAAKIVKEFKSPEESTRIQTILKQLAPLAQASIKE